MNQAIMQYLTILGEREEIEARFRSSDLTRFNAGKVSIEVDSHGRRLRRLWLAAWLLDQEIDGVVSVTVQHLDEQWLLIINSDEQLILESRRFHSVIEWLNIYACVQTSACTKITEEV